MALGMCSRNVSAMFAVYIVLPTPDPYLLVMILLSGPIPALTAYFVARYWGKREKQGRSNSYRFYTDYKLNMKNFKSTSLFLLIIFAFNSLSLLAQEDIGNEYRITLFPSHKVTDKIGGFGYLGYVWNPEKNYQTLLPGLAMCNLHTKNMDAVLGRSYRGLYQ